MPIKAAILHHFRVFLAQSGCDVHHCYCSSLVIPGITASHNTEQTFLLFQVLWILSSISLIFNACHLCVNTLCHFFFKSKCHLFYLVLIVINTFFFSDSIFPYIPKYKQNRAALTQIETYLFFSEQMETVVYHFVVRWWSSIKQPLNWKVNIIKIP